MKYFLVLLLSCAGVCAQNTNASNGTQVKNGTQFSNVIVGGGGGSTTFVISGHGTARSDNQANVGMEFTPSVGMTITDLGRMVSSGNTGTRVVSVYDPSVSSTIAIAQATVSATGTADTYNFASCTPVSLTSGHAYVIASAEQSSQNWYSDDGAMTTTSDAAINFSAFYNGAGFSINTAGRCYVPVNFKYTVP